MTLEERIEAMHVELRELRALIERGAPATVERQSQLVDAQEAARLLGLSVRSIREGKAGTGAIARQQSRPILFLRSDLLRFIRERAEQQRSPKQRALRLLDRSKSRRKRAA
jgi:hypothetical protein